MGFLIVIARCFGWSAPDESRRPDRDTDPQRLRPGSPSTAGQLCGADAPKHGAVPRPSRPALVTIPPADHGGPAEVHARDSGGRTDPQRDRERGYEPEPVRPRGEGRQVREGWQVREGQRQSRRGDEEHGHDDGRPGLQCRQRCPTLQLAGFGCFTSRYPFDSMHRSTARCSSSNELGPKYGSGDHTGDPGQRPGHARPPHVQKS
jgi:hypothetical protein